MKQTTVPKIIAWVFTIIAFFAQLNAFDTSRSFFIQLGVICIVLYVWWLIIYSVCKWAMRGQK